MKSTIAKIFLFCVITFLSIVNLSLLLANIDLDEQIRKPHQSVQDRMDISARINGLEHLEQHITTNNPLPLQGISAAQISHAIPRR